MERASEKNRYHYNSALTAYAQANRRTLTKSAACMWKYVLGRKQMLGYQFRRERPILKYIADFVCLELMLIIEVDGKYHDDPERKLADSIRDADLLDVGFTTLRFTAETVLTDIDIVINVISLWIEEKCADNERQG